ncbi:hypothetical protein EJC49_18275 [Aquibium carbonis]|uniref:Uncharacterized protein n=1 Tax=Aquibium carbonis TaxID=2495581 RepID=A0A3S0G6J7_9HYPH|nr:hypothetical protein [Aquibium carbonis]RST84897.1 hypothetical protein EJC49_18275 [Aquibium carbonis]
MDGNEPFWLFLGVVAIMAAFAMVRNGRRRPSRPSAHRWGRDGGDASRQARHHGGAPGFSGNDSSRGPGSTDSGASDGGGGDGGWA